jgi:hypothetical protein
VGHLLLLREPAGQVEVEALADPGGPAAQLGWQRGVDLELGRGQDRAEPQVGGGPGSPASASASASSGVSPVSRVR